jgi:hypothetical protein
MFSSSIIKVDFVVNIARTVLCFLLKSNLTSPSHSTKFTGGGGFLISMRTTRESTCEEKIIMSVFYLFSSSIYFGDRI